jgi:hypothetical protein
MEGVLVNHTSADSLIVQSIDGSMWTFSLRTQSQSSWLTTLSAYHYTTRGFRTSGTINNASFVYIIRRTYVVVANRS